MGNSKSFALGVCVVLLGCGIAALLPIPVRPGVYVLTGMVYVEVRNAVDRG